MQLLNHRFNLDSFFNTLQIAEKRILMLDFDGTLAPFKARPSEAYPYQEVLPVLKQLIASAKNRVIIISGRAIKDLKPLLKLESLPELWGCHGLEHLTAEGSYTIQKMTSNVSESISTIENWANENRLDNIIEKKPFSLAFHCRMITEKDAESIKQMVIEKWSHSISTSNLSLKIFDGGIEIRPMDINKGKVVKNIVSNEDSNHVISYLGDDITDEDAFQALKGHGLSVLVRPVLRETIADIWLKPPGELVDFLRQWL